MPKTKSLFICDSCGNESLKWAGRCPFCGEWNSLREIKDQKSDFKDGPVKTAMRPEELAKIRSQDLKRISSGSLEFDQVLGGGIVPGSIILLGGDPGIGKSTLILKVASEVKDSLYVSGEESLPQIKIRADRLGIKKNILMLSETDIETIAATIKKIKPRLVIIDSIQAVQDENIASTPGSISQVKSCALKLQRVAKGSKVPIILIGHVTKEGAVAGPKTLEHLVDTVLYLEGNKFLGQRILRATKNRFGSTGETAVFEMRGKGMIPVEDISSVFLKKEDKNSFGRAIFATLEGSRVFLLEVQALTSRTSFGYPRRTASGIDLNRLNLLAAVLTERGGIRLQESDIYVNILGGVRVREPAVDLAIVMAIASSYKKRPLPEKSLFLGEVGLSGEIRSVYGLEKRILQGARLGFKVVFLSAEGKKLKSEKIRIIPLKNIRELIEKAL